MKYKFWYFPAVPAVESDGFDVDDDLDPEVLSILDQVECKHFAGFLR